MDVNNSHATGGSLQISSEVIGKIARLAALEIEGVCDVTVGTGGVKNLLNRINPQNPVSVEMKDDVADVTIELTVAYGAKIPEISEKVQENVKNSVQNMTQISVARVNIVVAGIGSDTAPAPEDEVYKF